jgi:pimeloyl-ACP methyl ester carboxylesterase
VHTARAALDARGQRVSATDRLYLAAELPTLIVWGERDPIIPVAHGRAAHAAIPGSRLEVFADAGHFPHREDPLRFVSVLEDFLRSTRAATIAESRWRELLRAAS